MNMKRNPSNSIINNAARCQHRTPTGRQCCSSAQTGSPFCQRHAAIPRHESAEDFAVTLLRDARNFQSPQGINHSLGQLYALLAQGCISPRRASVLAYISSLLLRTLPAIDNDPFPLAGLVPVPQEIPSAPAPDQHLSQAKDDAVAPETGDESVHPSLDDVPKNSKPN
jgi:hypothetical protein